MAIKKLTRKKNAPKTYQVETQKDGEKVMLEVKTACQTFSMPILDAMGNFVYSDGMSKCKNCSPEVKEACIAKNNPDIKIVKEGAGSKGYAFPAEGTQAYLIDTCLVKGITAPAAIAKETGLKTARVQRRLKAIKERGGCPYFA